MQIKAHFKLCIFYYIFLDKTVHLSHIVAYRFTINCRFPSGVFFVKFFMMFGHFMSMFFSEIPRNNTPQAWFMLAFSFNIMHFHGCHARETLYLGHDKLRICGCLKLSFTGCLVYCQMNKKVSCNRGQQTKS